MTNIEGSSTLKYGTAARLLPLYFVGIVSLALYCSFIAFQCGPLLQLSILPEYRDPETVTEGLKELGIFHVIVVLFVWSIVQTIITDPGQIPSNDEWKKAPGSSTKVRKASGSFRFCKFERKYKPDRTHYCRPLGRNVLRMDHYCPWVGNCIGYFNYKYFLLSVLYSTIASLFMAVYLSETLKNIWSNSQTTFATLYFTMLCATLSAVLVCILTPFFAFHMWITSKNCTTIEFCEKWQGKDSILTLESPYDNGILSNFKDILGSNFYFWLIPVKTVEGDGLQFNYNESLKSSLLA